MHPEPWVGVVPRNDHAWAALVLALCTLALAYPALTGGFLVNPVSDQYIGGYPVRNFAAMSVKAGQGIPLWSPYLFGGMPYVAAMHGGIFYPTFLLRAVLRTDVAMTWSFRLLAATTQGILTPTLWRHENDRFLYTNVDPETLQRVLSQIGVSGLDKILGPVKNASGTQIYLYRVQGENPIAWLAPVFAKAAGAEALSAVLDFRFDPTRVAILDSNATIPAQQIRELPRPLTIAVKLESFALGRIRLSLAAPPPAGTALIVDDAAYERGKLITLVAVALAAVLALLGAFATRRHQAPGASV